MVSLKLGETLIKRDGNRVYIIAEIGQNHQGSLVLAKQMILEAKKIGCDCVKFQKSCLEAKFTQSALRRPYESQHSWGKTYGEHKKHLEFSIQQYQELQTFCKQVDIDFTASAMDEISLHELNSIKVPFIKIGSGDANNFPLLEMAAKLECPLVISTGMQTIKTIERIVDIMHNANKLNYALLHCVSSYPTEAKNSKIGMIRFLKNKFSHCVIGYSGHELGIEISKAAVLLGARIVERHFTLDKRQKGSDHKCSLEPFEMAKLIDDIKNLAPQISSIKLNNATLTNDDILNILDKTTNLVDALESFKENEKRSILPCEMDCRIKLGKSIVTSHSLKLGKVIELNDLCVKTSEPNGISAEYIESVLGAKLIRDVEGDCPLMWNHIMKMESTKF